ncbi:hypothetical protein EDB85DRAFT_1893536 [Lactarius pseudohatsudake]|nr:hypothetical protein EDB85DRAFT_1893536 [Lactarius pseudohatsudake]
MAVAVVGVAVAAAIAATICGSRVADDVGGPSCGRRRATRVFGGLRAGVCARGGGSVMAVVLHQFEMRGKEKERKKEEDLSKISVEHPCVKAKRHNQLHKSVHTPQPRTTKRFVDEDDRDHNRDGGYGDDNKNTTTVGTVAATATTKGPRAATTTERRRQLQLQQRRWKRRG